SEYDVIFNNGQRKPSFTPLNMLDADFSNFEFGELTEENQYTEEQDFNLFTNFKLPLNLFQQEDGFLKFGVRARLKNKNRDNDFTEYSPESTDFESLGSVPTRDYSDINFLAGRPYAVGAFA